MQEKKQEIQHKEVLQAIEGCINNERAAQKKLYDYASPSIYPIAKRYSKNEDDTQHIFNQAFVKIFANIEQVKDAEVVLPWMKRITVNCAIDFIRQNKRFTDKHVSYDTADDIRETMGIVYENITNKMEMDEFLEALKKEKPQHHTVFSLYHIYGFSHKEIGEKLKITQELSRYYLREARKFLQNLFITL
jgi:RNA polymerase sigma-70 factor (ECF subfamily)